LALVVLDQTVQVLKVEMALFLEFIAYLPLAVVEEVPETMERQEVQVLAEAADLEVEDHSQFLLEEQELLDKEIRVEMQQIQFLMAALAEALEVLDQMAIIAHTVPQVAMV
jgi:hypothetical protein